MRRTFGSLRWAGLACALAAVAGCSGSYEIEGRVVRGTLGTVMIVDSGDQLLDGAGVAGANIRAVRDPSRLNRQEVGSTVSDSEGRFRMRIDTFGAGVLNEEWLFIARRPGTTGAEGIFRLPSKPDRHRILVTLATGQAPEADERWSSDRDELMRDYERFR